MKIEKKYQDTVKKGCQSAREETISETQNV